MSVRREVTNSGRPKRAINSRSDISSRLRVPGKMHKSGAQSNGVSVIGACKAPECTSARADLANAALGASVARWEFVERKMVNNGRDFR